MNEVFKLSRHAQKRLRQRGIRLEWAEHALRDPDRLEYDEDDPELLHAVKRIHGVGTLRVVYNPNVEPWNVVTAYFDQRFRR